MPSEDGLLWRQDKTLSFWKLMTGFFPYRKTIQWVEKVGLTEAFVSYSFLSPQVLVHMLDNAEYLLDKVLGGIK